VEIRRKAAHVLAQLPIKSQAGAAALLEALAGEKDPEFEVFSPAR